LIVVDVQHIFGDEHSTWRADNFYPAKANIDRLVPHFDTVVFTKFVPPRHPSGAWRLFYEGRPDLLHEPENNETWDLVIQPDRSHHIVTSHQVRRGDAPGMVVWLKRGIDGQVARWRACRTRRGLP
jgi:hypothetical protein